MSQLHSGANGHRVRPAWNCADTCARGTSPHEDEVCHWTRQQKRNHRDGRRRPGATMKLLPAILSPHSSSNPFSRADQAQFASQACRVLLACLPPPPPALIQQGMDLSFASLPLPSPPSSGACPTITPSNSVSSIEQRSQRVPCVVGQQKRTGHLFVRSRNLRRE